MTFSVPRQSGSQGQTIFASHGVFLRYEPLSDSVPILFEVPQSGTTYPNDFSSPVPCKDLHFLISPYVEDLLQGVVTEGCTLLQASFPMTYVNANRSPNDIDESMLSETWSGADPSSKIQIGIGLIQKWVQPGIPIYDRLLNPAEIRTRIDRYYDPYHAEIARILSEFKERYGYAWHVDCHCMGSYGSSMSPDPGKRRADFCLGDRDGTTCDAGLRDCMAELLRGMGFSVSINDPFKGVEIVRRHGAPNKKINSIQLEIGRGLFLNETTNEPSDNYRHISECLRKLAKGMIDYSKSIQVT